MGDPRRLWTVIGAISFAVAGIVMGAGVSAWLTRDTRAEPWRKLHVEHEGTDGVTTRTRLVFENPKLPLQAIEVIRDPGGHPQRALIALRDGQELTAKFEDDLPASIEGPDGAKALFSFKGGKARVAFFRADGRGVGDKVVTIPVELVSALRLAQLETPTETSSALGSLFDGLIGTAWAQDDAKEEDEDIDVVRDVEVLLDVAMPGAKSDSAGKGQIETSCAPFTCLAVTADVKTPGESTVRITVAGTKKKSALKAPSGGGALGPFKDDASRERKTATRVLPDVTATIAAVGVTALACKSLELDWPICADGLSKSAAGGAVYSVASHEVQSEGRLIDKRAEALYYQEQARAELDEKVNIEICVTRDGYARACAKLDGRPFGEKAMPRANAKVELRRGIGGTLVGSHVLTQSDGGDCKFSPSPKAAGSLRMSFDGDKGVLSATLKADERGTRSNLRCSMGSANMSWTQNYTISVSQTFTKEQLNAGGKLALRLTGDMKGVGSYSFSNCRSSGGVSGSCPGGKREAYSYAAELTGELDLDTQRGSGNISVSKAPLGTRGTWQIPAVTAP